MKFKEIKIDEYGVGIVTKQNATKDVPVGGEYMNVKKLGLNKKPKKKTKSKQNITLVKDSNIISNDKAVADEFSRVFEEAVKKLDIPSISISDYSGIQDPIESYIHRYQNHPSILKIREKMSEFSNENVFIFKNTNYARVSKWIKSLKPGKSKTFQHIPGKIIKNNIDVFTPTMTNLINDKKISR